MSLQVIMPPMNPHERRVAEMMAGFGQAVPSRPRMLSLKDRLLRSRLKLEETLEFPDAAAVDLVVKPGKTLNPGDRVIYGEGEADNVVFVPATDGRLPDMQKMIDACSDDSVVNTGTFVAMGVRMDPMLELTDANNLMKIANGHLDAGGKFIKSPTHPVPNYRVALELQGWAEPVEPPPAYAPAPPKQTLSDVVAETFDRPRSTSKQHMTPTLPEIVGPTQHDGPPPRIPQALAGVLQPLPTGEVVYFGSVLEQALEALRGGRKPYACQLITRSMREMLGTGLPRELVPDEHSLRQTAPGDPGPRGVAFRAVTIQFVTQPTQ